MDLITRTLTTLIKKEPEWINYLTKYPQNTKHLTQRQMTDYKSLDLTNYNSRSTYEIIKKLLSSRGIRSVHPVWFFIFKEQFENDNFIFEEEDTLDITLPENFVMPHRIQIIGTLKIYYTLLTNSKLRECFIDKRSEFIKSYPEFKEFYKYLFFPEIEKKVHKKFIDLSYEFENNFIEVEINEPEHDENDDIEREQLIYFKTNNRIIQCYLSKDVRQKDTKIDIIKKINKSINDILPKVINNIFFRLTMVIFKTNKYAGLTFNAFVKDIINNLFLAIFFGELKKESQAEELTLEKFIKYCHFAGVNIDNNYVKIIINELPDDKIERDEDLNDLFYNFTKLNGKTLLKETGYDYYLMQLKPEQTKYSLKIKKMYSKYKQEYDSLMEDIILEKDKELDYITNYAWSKKHFLEMANRFQFE